MTEVLELDRENWDSSDIAEIIQNLAQITYVSTISHSISASVESRVIKEYPFLETLWEKYFSSIEDSQKAEVKRTIDYLYTKLQSLFPKILEKFNVTEDALLEAIGKRLADQIQEAKINGRKFTNGTVGSLKKITEGGNFILEKIPYWAFGSTNVSLDVVKINTKFWEIYLREIMESFDYTDEQWEFYLPGSLGVSVMIQLSDGTVVCQERNNKLLLTQYSWLVSSASGAVTINDDTANWFNSIAESAVAELQEELWVKSISIPHFPDIADIAKDIQGHILRELNLEETGALIPVGIVMERKRHKYEVVFTVLLPEKYTMETIIQKWASAPDKSESLRILGVTTRDIESQLDFYNTNIPEDLRGKPVWLEDFIKTLSVNTDWVWPHLLMSYLTWVKACEESIEKIRKRSLDLTL